MARLLLTNDDGVHGTGIQTLYRVLEAEHEVWMVAPSLERSTTGHTLTLDQPLHLQQLDQRIWGCSGFPADCSFIALGHVLAANPPELVLSGINYGANLGQDIFYSGTVAAAREAYFRGKHAIALSLALSFQDKGAAHYFGDAANFVAEILRDESFKKLLQLAPWLLNINFPNLQRKDWRGLSLAIQGRRHYSEKIERRVDCRDREYFWICGQYEGHDQLPGSDCQLVADGYVSITILGPPMPHRSDKRYQLNQGLPTEHLTASQEDEEFRSVIQHTLETWNRQWF